MKRLHIVSDRNPCNGMFVAASLMAAHEEGSRVITCAEFLTTDFADYTDYEEVVVHGCWLPCYWKCCWRILRESKREEVRRKKGEVRRKKGGVRSKKEEVRRKKCGVFYSSTSNFNSPSTSNFNSPRLTRMTHANLDPVRLAYHGWKKRLVAPIERWLFRRCDKILVTCPEEAEWVSSWLGRAACPHVDGNKIEIVDLKKFFRVNAVGDGTPTLPPKARESDDRSLHVLYLGRRHPLKGIEYLERAVSEINEPSIVHLSPTPKIELRIVSNHSGEELERDWGWCDVLCLPTLSENFGLVIAEALERGKRVITTDGAPAWEPMEKAVSGQRLAVSDELLASGDDNSALSPNSKNASIQNALTYLRGYRDGSEEKRVALLKDALLKLTPS